MNFEEFLEQLHLSREEANGDNTRNVLTDSILEDQLVDLPESFEVMRRRIPGAPEINEIASPIHTDEEEIAFAAIRLDLSSIAVGFGKNRPGPQPGLRSGERWCVAELGQG